MNNEERQFKRHLEEYWQSKGIQNIKVPQIGGRDLDFYLLYKSVTKRGGAQQVSMNKLWKEVVNEFGLPPSCTSASFTLRNHYSRHFYYEFRYLLAYEQKFFFGKNDSQAIKELQGSRIRKIIKMNDDEQDQIRQDVITNQGISNAINEYGLDNQNQPQLRQILSERYQNRKQQEEIYYVKKNKTQPYQSEIKRIILAFESRMVREIVLSLNSLLLYSCNNIQPFILEQHPALLDQIIKYWIILLKFENVENQPSNSVEISYEIHGEIVELEQNRIISQILRNLSLIKMNQITMTKNKQLLLIIQKIIISQQDFDIKKCCYEIFAQLSKHFSCQNIFDYFEQTNLQIYSNYLVKLLSFYKITNFNKFSKYQLNNIYKFEKFTRIILQLNLYFQNLFSLF